MTFNTLREAGRRETIEVVLNLVINGWPSIHGLEFHIPNVS